MSIFHDLRSEMWWSVEFTLLGNNQFATLNGGPYFKHSCAASWMIPCKNQEELDYYYDKLSAKAEAEICWWIEDKFGVSWQLIPDNFTQYMKSDDTEKIQTHEMSNGDEKTKFRCDRKKLIILKSKFMNQIENNLTLSRIFPYSAEIIFWEI